MHPVFISYNNADRHLASELSLGLEAAGYTTWYYDRDTQVGFNYMDYVGTSIVECSAMVLLISPLSVHSAQVTREVMRACEENKFILPLLRHDVRRFSEAGADLAAGPGWDRGRGTAGRGDYGHCP